MGEAKSIADLVLQDELQKAKHEHLQELARVRDAERGNKDAFERKLRQIQKDTISLLEHQAMLKEKDRVLENVKRD